MFKHDPLSEVHQRRLSEILPARSSHPEMAAAAALDYCVQNAVDPPWWAVQDAAKALLELLLREKPSVRGRRGSLLARYRQDQIDFERWDAVLTARWNQKRVADRIRALEESPAFMAQRPKHVMHQRKLLAWLGKSWDRAYEVAAMHLLGTEAFAGPEAVKASYKRVQRVERVHKTGERSSQYARFPEEFMAKLGIQNLSEPKRGSKRLPIYNLTLPF